MSRARDTANLISNNQQVRAWCSFNGNLTGTNAPEAGYNVASVTRVSTGVYQINFIEPMDNIYYSMAGLGFLGNHISIDNSTRNVNYAQITCRTTTNNAQADAGQICVHVFGGLD